MRPSLRVVSDELTAQILDEAKRILAEIGVEILGENLRQKMLDSGLTQDRESGRIRFPPDVVDKAIASAPRSFRLYNRNGDFHTELGGDKVHFVPGSSALNLLDHRTGEHREAITSDFVEYVRVADGLPHIAYLATAFSTRDIEPQVSDAWRLYLCLTHSLKPVVSGAFTEHGVPRMAEMMQLFRRDKADLRARPLSVFTVTPTGLFRFSEDSSQNLIDCVEWGIPIEMVPVTLMGLIAPVTLVGATIFHVADVLSGLTLAQILKPGHPVLFGGAPATFHMKAASSPMAAIEAVHLDTAYVAVAKHLGLPTQSYMALSEGKFLDAQAGAETFGSALLAALAGVNSVSGPGMLDYVLTFSLEKLVFDDELCGQALHFLRELQPLDDLPAVDLVRELLNERHMLTAEHTLKYWRDVLYFPNPVIDRLNRDKWLKTGGLTLLQRVRAEVEKRLAAYQPIETDPRAVEEMHRLIQSGLSSQEALPPTVVT
ncbi:MAG TPA: trimethylamine methyltransferase family protein [Anaerolineales bacterium]|nr:trimethylamine methyltransferase family protein [Anaerolineales bacterium]